MILIRLLFIAIVICNKIVYLWFILCVTSISNVSDVNRYLFDAFNSFLIVTFYIFCKNPISYETSITCFGLQLLNDLGYASKTCLWKWCIFINVYYRTCKHLSTSHQGVELSRFLKAFTFCVCRKDVESDQ